MNRLWLILITIALTACAIEKTGEPIVPADPDARIIYTNGVILTMDPALPAAEAIAVRGEMIEAVGSNDEILALGDGNTTRIDLEGRTLMPGFVDAHTHLLNDARSRDMSLDQAQAQALRNGITTLGTLYTDESFLREITAFANAGYLHIRTSLYLVATDPCGNPLGDWWKDYPPTDEPGEMLRINGVKVFTDGGSCGRVALSFEPEPGLGTGDLWFTQEELNEMVAEVDAAGYQAAVHAIGDRAVHQALNAIEAALDGRPNDLRHRMEHVSVIDPADIPRFGEIGVIPVLMGEYPGCTPYGPPIPEEFGSWEWPWRALREANPGLSLAWHTDVPFQSINPFDHLLGFVTRIDRLGQVVCDPFPWLVDNTISVEQALSIMTIQSAYALRRETEVGSLAPGKYADLIILENNPLEMTAQDLADNHVLLTMVGGRVEYCSTSASDLCPGHANRAPVLLPDTRPPVLIRWLVLVIFALVPIGMMLSRRRYPDFVRRTGGAAGLLGGLAWVAMLFSLAWLTDTFFILFFVLPVFLMALGAAGLAAISPPGRLTGIGLWSAALGATAVSIGGVLSEWFRLDAGWFLLMIGILTHAIGLVLFGIANLRTRVLKRWNGLPLLMGLFGGILPLAGSFGLGYESDLPVVLLLGVMGGGWVLLGGRVLFAKK